jgi:hypothetical protein
LKPAFQIIKDGRCFCLPQRGPLFGWWAAHFFLETIELGNALDGLFHHMRPSGFEQIYELASDVGNAGHFVNFARTVQIFFERQSAQQASNRLIALQNGGDVTIQRFGQNRYDRTLASVWVDGVDVGETLMAESLARGWPDGPEFWCN